MSQQKYENLGRLSFSSQPAFTTVNTEMEKANLIQRNLQTSTDLGINRDSKKNPANLNSQSHTASTTYQRTKSNKATSAPHHHIPLNPHLRSVPPTTTTQTQNRRSHHHSITDPAQPLHQDLQQPPPLQQNSPLQDLQAHHRNTKTSGHHHHSNESSLPQHQNDPKPPDLRRTTTTLAEKQQLRWKIEPEKPNKQIRVKRAQIRNNQLAGAERNIEKDLRSLVVDDEMRKLG
jgi:hypothetical protein